MRHHRIGYMDPSMHREFLNTQLELLDVFIELSSSLTWWLEGDSLFHYFCNPDKNNTLRECDLWQIEIGMPRADYETYLKRANKLEIPYFNKSYKSDLFPCGYSRLMDLRTTALILKEGEFWQKEKKQGIYISINPFDNVPIDDSSNEWIRDILSNKTKVLNNYILTNCNIRETAVYTKSYIQYDSLLKKFNNENTSFFANLSRMQKGFCDIRRKSEYKHLLEVDFYGRKAYVPHETDVDKEKLLARIFHPESINKIDTRKPYTKYLFKKKRLSDEEFLNKLNLKIDISFLKDETRWSYRVTKEMKKVWAVELDLINEFDRVCKELGLQWWIDGGTMLGAIRHKGFIPWDDDVDVAMLRQDFDKLLEHCDEFKGRYFLQSFETDRLVMTKYRLLNLETTAMGYENYVSPLARFQMTGFIDIFAFENIRDIDDWRQRSQSKTEKKKLASQLLKSYYLTDDPKALEQAESYYKQYKDITIGDCTDEETELLANVTLTACDNRFKRYRKDYEETIYVPFEMLSLPCPKNWERCLELQYGKNWRTPIMGTQYHSCWIYDSDNAYNDYVRYLTDLVLNKHDKKAQN